MKKYIPYIVLGLIALAFVTGLFFWQQRMNKEKQHLKRLSYAKMLWSPKAKITPEAVTLAKIASQKASIRIDQPIATTGCNTAMHIPAGTTTAVTINSDNVERTYFIYIPTNFDNTTQH